MIVREQIVRKLCEPGRLLVDSIPRPGVMRHLEISRQTYQWGVANMGPCDLRVWHDSKRWNKKTPA